MASFWAALSKVTLNLFLLSFHVAPTIFCYSNKLIIPTFTTEIDHHSYFLIYCVEYLYRGWKSHRSQLVML